MGVSPMSCVTAASIRVGITITYSRWLILNGPKPPWEVRDAALFDI